MPWASKPAQLHIPKAGQTRIFKSSNTNKDIEIKIADYDPKISIHFSYSQENIGKNIFEHECALLGGVWGLPCFCDSVSKNIFLYKSVVEWYEVLLWGI